MKIVTTFIYPPIPIRNFDWLAMYDIDDGDSPRKGYGATKQEAIADLLAEWEPACPRCAMPALSTAGVEWPDCKCPNTD